MNYNKSFAGLFLAILVLLPGCILHVPSYRAQRLRLIRDNFTYNETEKNITLGVKLLTEEDKYDLFGEHIGALEEDDFYIVYLSIHNLSDKNYVLTSHRIDLEQLSSRAVITSMKKTSSIGRLSVWYFSSVPPAILASFVHDPLVIAPVSIGFGITGLIGFVQGIKSIVMNGRVRKDIEEKIVSKKVIIKSGGYYDGLMFVKSIDYKSQFNVQLRENDNRKKIISFDVDLKSE